MKAKVNSLIQRKAWKDLAVHHKKIGKLHLRDLFAKDPNRGQRMTAEAAGLFLDYSKSVLEEILPDVDQVLVMTVNPGFGHQHFLRSTLPKIRRVRRLMEQSKPECRVEVDGGIDPETAPLAVAAGANVLVAGTAIFGNSQGVAAAMKSLQSAANDAANEIQT